MSSMPECPYCSASPDEAWIVTDDAVAVPHPVPVAPCHMVVAPRRHVQTFYELDVGEQHIVWDLVSEIRKRISDALKVTGFEIGFADGDPEHQIHAHVHVVPRAEGDHVELPGGVQWVKD